jgi:acyl-CoA hydrolase
MHYIVTEHGVAYLYGKNLHQRAMELIKIAAPEHREKLEMYVRERFGKRIFGMT